MASSVLITYQPRLQQIHCFRRKSDPVNFLLTNRLQVFNPKLHHKRSLASASHNPELLAPHIVPLFSPSSHLNNSWKRTINNA
ncbi:hypothetical protein BVRB_007330 [Beta vulgaris subsp. vulgaris]|uniref:Uncharacterized protein n=1 Tax=Beta vulgaris subsp. vulgaris TaxID=3555 RepID=A0A0J8B361_BETVV|nr:hypothetical protein BVRB_007330 [Beta vulgaris subsp. vulgaris]